MVENGAPVGLQLLEGETLVGGNQDRTLNVTVLLPPGSTVVVPVSCVEAGRWGSTSHVDRSRSHLSAKIRAAKIANLSGEDGPGRWRSNQGRVWQEVADAAGRHGVRSETSALKAVADAVREELGGLLSQLEPVAGQVGVACATGSAVLGVDVFDRPERSGATSRRSSPGPRSTPRWTPPPRSSARSSGSWPRSAGAGPIGGLPSASARSCGCTGTGSPDGVTGLCLEVDGELVHLAAFPDDAPVS